MPDLLIKKTGAAERFRSEGGNILFFASLFLFLSLLAVYGGLKLFNGSQERAKTELLEEVRLKEEELRPELVNQIFFLESKLKNLRAILAGHAFPSNVFRFLEENTLERARFTSFNFVSESLKLDMAGEAANYSILSQQIGVFERHPQVKEVEFGGLSSGENKVTFRLAIIFKPTLLQIKN